MKYFQTKFKTDRNRDTIVQSLKGMISESTNDLFIFPFCLFKKSYYEMLRKKRKSPFNGKVNSNTFELQKTIIYGNISSGMTSRVLTIKGKIVENGNDRTVTMEFHSPQIEIILQAIILIGCLILLAITGNYLFLVIPVLLILDRGSTTLKNHQRIKKRIVE